MFGRGREKENQKKKHYALRSFLLNLFIAFLIFIPFIFHWDGLFTLGDDFDAQEIPFNIFANREIKELDIFYNWGIDLGSDFISSFSFYNLGSPFFWITLLFKPETFPWLVGWILILKYACAGWTSFLWIRRHTSDRTALLGSVLYAFSGYQAMNMIFYHFHDAVALFPLLMIGFELLVTTKKKGLFALTVALNTLVNWNFFVGEVIFVVFYYLCFCEVIANLRKDRESRREVGWQFLHLLGEGTLGVGIASAIFIPTVYAMFFQSRVRDTLPVSDWFLWSGEDWLRNLKALLFPAEAMNNNSVLSEMNWFSAGAYLPMIGAILCITWIIRHRGERSPLSRGLIICFIISCIPVLNSVFVVFNIEPYRRWYYMPILLMALASARTVEELQEEDERTGRIAARVSVGVLVAMGLFALGMALAKISGDDPGTELDAIRNLDNWILVLVTALSGAALTLLIPMICRKYRVKPLALLTVGCCCFAWLTQTFVVIEYRQSAFYSPQQVYTKLILQPRELEQDVLPYRYAFLDNAGYFNAAMTYSLPSIYSFLSIVDPGITEFYEALGVGRHVRTVGGPVGTDRLLSVKYYTCTRQELTPLKGIEPTEVIDANGWKLSVIDEYYALPIGQGYDTYILRSEFDGVPMKYRAIVMLHDLVIRDEDESKVKDLLTHSDYQEYLDREELWIPKVDVRSRDQSVQLVRTKKAFRILYPSVQDEYVFLSVPYSTRWSATVNGDPTEILNICGLMAVRGRAGLCDIRFYYDITVFLIGFGVTGVSVLITFVILMRERKRRKALVEN